MIARSSLYMFWGFWFSLAALWLALNSDIANAANLFALRDQMMQFSGTLAISAMSIAMILSLRSQWSERLFGGLDKSYRIHKWLGIGALGLAVYHWLWSQAPKWAVSAGLIARPTRGPRQEITDPIQSYLFGFRHTAEEMGEWAFYVIGALLVIAIVKLIPYRYFRHTHRVMPAIYLVLVFHALVLFDYALWLTPLGVILAILLSGGTFAALVSLTGQIGRGRTVSGTITALHHYKGVRSLETEIELAPGWPGHAAGQFAFATSNAWEGAHPYTLASSWDPNYPTVTFVTKELGDHTTGLVNKLHVGQKVKVEGPYGRFTFDDDRPRQIWIGGGIGITPFIARLKELANQPEGTPRPEIDLFHTSREEDAEAFARLMEDAANAGVDLHLMLDHRDGFLTGEAIRERVPDWREASLWFCGPRPFGKALRKDFAEAGLDIETRFHQELFEMR